MASLSTNARLYARLAVLRRRITGIGQRALQAAWSLPASHDAPIVFASRDGECARTISILEATWGPGNASATVDVTQQVRDIAEVPAIEVITTSAVHLMSAAAVKCGLAEGPDAEALHAQAGLRARASGLKRLYALGPLSAAAAAAFGDGG